MRHPIVLTHILSKCRPGLLAEVLEEAKSDTSKSGAAARRLPSGLLEAIRSKIVTQGRIAREAGVSVSFVSAAERGQFPVRGGDAVVRLLEVYADMRRFLPAAISTARSSSR